MSADAAVEEVPVWLEINGRPAVTWMCTPDLLEELAVGWLHGEGYVDSADQVRLRPCATDLGFWATLDPGRLAAVEAEGRRPVLASGCGAVSTFLADPATIHASPRRGPGPDLAGQSLLFHAEDIGRHNAVDKVVGAALLAGHDVSGLGLLVTGRISAELAWKGARAGIVYIATPSVPSTLAVEIARRTGMSLIGRAVSGSPQVHGTTDQP
jgi:FdhD protein